MNKYIPRIADTLIERALKSTGAVLVEGPKWCGKTSTARHLSKSYLYMQDPDQRSNYMKIADTKPSLLLRGDTPRLIDEWQIAPVLWDSVRHEVDMRGAFGQFILTGSAVPIIDEKITHTGTGRYSRIKMRTMSLYESGESNGSISLNELFDNRIDLESMTDLNIDALAKSIVRGGWPATISNKYEDASKPVQDYLDSIINIDISRVDGIEKNPQKVAILLKSLARNISTQASVETIRRDMEGNEQNSVSQPTVLSYLNALQRIFVIEDLEAWNPAIRSKTPLRSSSKRHFIDPSIACASLGINESKLLLDFNTFGYLFESMCIRDLRVYADYLDGKVYHYRDKSNLECDAIVVLRDGRWGAIEIKMGPKEFDTASENLFKLKERIDLDKMQPPSFLMILTATNIGYTREDGVHVVPIGCLKW